MEVRNSSFAAYIDVFTSNTYAMVVMSDVGICKIAHCLFGYKWPRQCISIAQLCFILTYDINNTLKLDYSLDIRCSLQMPAF